MINETKEGKPALSKPIRPFELPWVTDPEAVKRGIDQEWPRH